jgi:hypothetical protein
MTTEAGLMSLVLALAGLVLAAGLGAAGLAVRDLNHMHRESQELNAEIYARLLDDWEARVDGMLGREWTS